MRTCDVLIVGGGPAGSTCAGALHRAGLDVCVVDRARFPRDKTCAGWVTPAVFQTLEIDPAQYARERICQPISAFRIGRIGGAEVEVEYGRTVSYGIRRCEFDHYLLERSQAPRLLQTPVRSVRRDGTGWEINGQLRAAMLVAAGGHFCPVARQLVSDRARAPVVAAQEVEFAMNGRQQAACRVEGAVPELYFCGDLTGYGWCFRKGDFLNVGLGRLDRAGLSEHVLEFCQWLKQRGRIPPDLPGPFRGHAYYLHQDSPRKLLDAGVLAIGDAAGLAYVQSGEGIRPAIESGLMAAGVIADARGDYQQQRLRPYQELIEQRFGPRRTGRAAIDFVPGAVRRFLGSRLLGTRWFVRRVVLDRWFLHTHPPLQATSLAPGSSSAAGR